MESKYFEKSYWLIKMVCELRSDFSFRMASSGVFLL